MFFSCTAPWHSLSWPAPAAFWYGRMPALSPTITSTEDGKAWEHRYVAGACVSVGLLGIWCYVAFSRHYDPFVRVVSFSMTIAYVSGIFATKFW